MPPKTYGVLAGRVLDILDPAGLKVDGVAYTGHRARPHGSTIVF